MLLQLFKQQSFITHQRKCLLAKKAQDTESSIYLLKTG